jgi:histidine triad (HIT) family protein
MGCIFCLIEAGQAPSHRVYEDEHALAFMDINPAVPGHVLVIPRRHTPDLFGLEEHEVGPYMTAVHRVARQVRQALTPDGMNLFQSNGVAAWQTVFHLHVHVLPRRLGDSPNLPPKQVPGDAAELARLAAMIRGVE